MYENSKIHIQNCNFSCSITVNISQMCFEFIKRYWELTVSSRIWVFAEGIPLAHNGVTTFADTHRRYNVSSQNMTVLKQRMDWIANCLNIKNTLPYFCISNCRTYGSLENTTAGGTPYPHSSFGARSRPSPSRVRLVFLCFRVYWLYYEGILYLLILIF